MASQVLSGAANASYTNNTGQNVRLIINYMSNTTSMTWAGVNVTASATTIGKDIQNITGEFRGAATGKLLGTSISPSTNSAIYTYELNLTNKKLNLSERTSSLAPPKTVPAPNRVATVFSEPAGMFLTQENSIEFFTTTVVTGQQFLGVGTRDTTDYNADIDFTGFGESVGQLRSRTSDPNTSMPNIFYVPLTVSRGGNFPVELMLSNGQAFSAVCGAFNAIVIKEDGT